MLPSRPAASAALPASSFPAQVRTEDENYQGELQLQSYGVFRGKAELPDALPADQGLELSSAARKHGISTVFAEPLRTKGVGLVVQFELLLKQPLQCGGAALLTERRLPAHCPPSTAHSA